MHQYLIVGRRKPTEKNPESPVYRMKIFAQNSVIARSRFWYYLAALKKVKKANGEIVEIHEVRKTSSQCSNRHHRNDGLYERYDHRYGGASNYWPNTVLPTSSFTNLNHRISTSTRHPICRFASLVQQTSSIVMTTQPRIRASSFVDYHVGRILDLKWP